MVVAIKLIVPAVLLFHIGHLQWLPEIISDRNNLNYTASSIATQRSKLLETFLQFVKQGEFFHPMPIMR